MADEYEILEFMDIDYAYVLVAKQWLLQLLYRRVRNLDKWLHLSPCPNGCKGFSDQKKKKKPDFNHLCICCGVNRNMHWSRINIY